MTHTALIIDDEADIRELIAMSLDRIGLQTHTAANLEEATNLLSAYRFDVCLSDMKLPDGNGVEFVKHIHSIQPHLPVAVITAHGSMDAAVEAMKNGAFDFVSKPVDLKLLRGLVMQAVKSDSHAAKKQNNPRLEPGAQSASTLEDLSGRQQATTDTNKLIGDEKLIGTSEPMLQLKRMIAKVARTNAPIWITGESGTGKELIARLIHENSTRANEPFVAINCGAIPAELMESELFGHKKGSFTGAHSDHDGLFKRADSGTLFLDEVAELPIHMQVKLLRAIQERSVRPVGAAEEIPTNVRILSACHKDLANEVELGHFRHDLYYRLNVISIQSPRLCDRADDIELIARSILNTLSDADGINGKLELDTSAIEGLSNYRFPGNVRELENILERAAALSDRTTLTADDLNLTDQDSGNNRFTAINSSDDSSNDKKRIQGALDNNRWNRKAAAEELGITYRQLRYRIKQYDLDRPSA